MLRYLPPTGWSDLATRQDLDALRAETRGEVKAVLPKLYAASAATALAVGGLVLAAVSIG